MVTENDRVRTIERLRRNKVADTIPHVREVTPAGGVRAQQLMTYRGEIDHRHAAGAALARVPASSRPLNHEWPGRHAG